MEEENKQEDGLSLSDIFRMFKKNIILILALTILGLAGGVTYSYAIAKPDYQSKGQVLVNVNKNGSDDLAYNDLMFAFNYVETISNFMVSEPVVQAVIDKIMVMPEYKDAYTAKEMKVFAGKVKAEAVALTSTTKSLFINVSSTNNNAKLAKALVDTTLSTAKEIADTDGNYTIFSGFIKITSLGSEAIYVSTSKLVITAVVTAVALVLGLVIAIIKEMLNNKVTSKDELEALTNIGVIGVIPNIENNEDKE